MRFLKAVTLMAGAGYVAWRFLRGNAPGLPEQVPDKLRSASSTVADAVPDKIADAVPDKVVSRSSNGAPDPSGMTKAQLYERAKELGIEGRSKMSKQDLERAIRDAG
jgi:hypothetical protein